MSLHIRLDINGKILGEVTITRPEDTFEIAAADEVTYRYDYSGALGTTTNGKITHRPMEGATALATKTLSAIYENRIRSGTGCDWHAVQEDFCPTCRPSRP